MDDIGIIVERLSCNGRCHCQNDQCVCDEGQRKTSQSAFGDRFAWVFQIARHTSTTIVESVAEHLLGHQVNLRKDATSGREKNSKKVLEILSALQLAACSTFCEMRLEVLHQRLQAETREFHMFLG